MCSFLTQERKPYTITKQREKWSTEEHERFLEALRLHGRAWRKIEGEQKVARCLHTNAPAPIAMGLRRYVQGLVMQ